MKKCPYCAEEIQDAAVICRFCQRELNAPPRPITPASTAPAAPVAGARRKTSPLAWGCLSVIVLFLVVAWCGTQLGKIAPQQSPSTAAPPATPDAQPPAMAQHDLALLSARGYESTGYHIVEGQVRNISGKPLQNVTAKATWFDKADGFVTSDDALIDYNPLLPGQTSAFKTMSRTNPEMSKYTVEFKYLMGGSIATDDRRKK